MSDDQKPTSKDEAAQGAGAANSDAETAQSNADADDLWAAAMAEQGVEPEPEPETPEVATSSPEITAKPSAVSAEAGVFPSFDEGSGTRESRDLGMIMDIPVKLSVELGRTRITIKQLLELAQGSVVELDGLAGEPMDILINGYLIAQGEVVVVEDKYGIRITEIVTPSERVQKLNR